MSPSRDRAVRILVSALVWAFVLGNVAAICWLWVANHNLDFSFAPNWWATLWSRLGGLTGLLGGFLALVQVLLLARLPFLGRTIGFDHLTLWHRWNGYLVVVLCVAHTVLAVQGRAMDVNQSFVDQFWALLAHGLQVGMVTATIGLALFLLVTVTSIAIVKRGLRYELWYWVHLTAYAGIAFAWFHEIPTGGDINGAFHPNAETYWRVLFFGTIGLVILFRVVVPVGSAFFYRLRVADVIAEGPTVTSIRIDGPPGREAATEARAVLPLAVPDRRVLVDVAPLLALGGTRRPDAPDQRQGRRRPHLAHALDPVRDARGRRGALRGVHRVGAAARQVAPDRGRDRDHACARARRDDGGRHHGHLPRPHRPGHRPQRRAHTTGRDDAT